MSPVSKYICVDTKSAVQISLYSEFVADRRQISLFSANVPVLGRYFTIRVSACSLFHLADKLGSHLESLALTVSAAVQKTVEKLVKKLCPVPVLRHSVCHTAALYRVVGRFRL